MDNQTERVIFRRWKDTGDVIAFFPDHVEGPGWIGSYMHVGQHGAAVYDPEYTRPASVDDSDVAALKRELESAPYRYQLRVMRRRSRK